ERHPRLPRRRAGRGRLRRPAPPARGGRAAHHRVAGGRVPPARHPGRVLGGRAAGARARVALAGVEAERARGAHRELAEAPAAL
ncbi:MAG: hypothetical protein AVDCRST_MAG68-920, partial [uncultured Gemmatimonadetes bacterium]